MLNGVLSSFIDILAFAKKSCPFMRREGIRRTYARLPLFLLELGGIDIYEERKSIPI